MEFDGEGVAASGPSRHLAEGDGWIRLCDCRDHVGAPDDGWNAMDNEFRPTAIGRNVRAIEFKQKQVWCSKIQQRIEECWSLAEANVALLDNAYQEHRDVDRGAGEVGNAQSRVIGHGVRCNGRQCEDVLAIDPSPAWDDEAGLHCTLCKDFLL